MFIRIYEDNVAGRITDEKFSMMSKTYEDEQTQLKVEIQTLQQEIEVQERQIENLEQFIQRVRKYEDLDELMPMVQSRRNLYWSKENWSNFMVYRANSSRQHGGWRRNINFRMSIV